MKNLNDPDASSKFVETRKISLFSNLEGFFSAIYATLTGGVFLTGFFLALGANSLHIGIIAAIPLLANSFQFIGSYLVHKFGQCKPVSMKSASLARPAWLLMSILPFFIPWLSSNQIILIALAVLAGSQMLAATSAVAWLSWISDLVPPTFRGRFFGKRNMIIGLAVIIFTFGGGRFLDYLGNRPEGFQVLFCFAVAMGVIGLRFLNRLPDSHVVQLKSSDSYLPKILYPFKDHNFRLLLLFSVMWSFAVHFAAPFFIVFKLSVLHLSYTYIAVLISITAVFDLIGQRFWGGFSDKVGNRPIMLMCSVFVAFLPLGWTLTTPESMFSLYILLPLMHVTGGFFWSGMNLTSANILFRLAPRTDNTIYFSAYASVNGLLAAAASLAGGIFGLLLSDSTIDVIFFQIAGLKIIFLISWILRCAAIPVLLRVNETEGLPVIQAVQVLRNIRSVNSTQGFHPLLHFFLSSAPSSEKKPGHKPPQDHDKQEDHSSG